MYEVTPLKRQSRYEQPSFEWPATAPESVITGKQEATEPPKPVLEAIVNASEPTTGAKLDAEGHSWWAALCRSAQEHCIGLVAEQKEPEMMKELAAIAGSWKRLAAKHEAKAFQMEGL